MVKVRFGLSIIFSFLDYEVSSVEFGDSEIELVFEDSLVFEDALFSGYVIFGYVGGSSSSSVLSFI